MLTSGDKRRLLSGTIPLEGAGQPPEQPARQVTGCDPQRRAPAHPRFKKQVRADSSSIESARMRTVGILAIVGANVVAGASYAWQKLAQDHGLEAGQVSLLRHLIALSLLVLFWLPKRRIRAPFTIREWIRISCVGVFAMGVPLVLGAHGVTLSTSSAGSILILLEPVSILVFSAIFLKEALGRTQIAGVALGLSGALLVVVRQLSEWSELFASEYFYGNAILALHGVLWGLYSPLMRPLAQVHRASDLTFWVLVLSMLPMLPLAIFETIQTAEANSQVDWLPALSYVAILAILVTLVATILWNFSLRILRASTVASFIFLQPLVGSVVGWLTYGEALTPVALVGALLITSAVLLVSRAPKPRELALPAS